MDRGMWRALPNDAAQSALLVSIVLHWFHHPSTSPFTPSANKVSSQPWGHSLYFGTSTIFCITDPLYHVQI